MDSLSDDALTQRIAELRATEAGKSLLEKIASASPDDFTPEEVSLNNRLSLFLAEQERRQVRAQYAAHIHGPGPADLTVHAKLDELLSAHGPARRELLGAKCDFKDKNGSDNNAAKRTWDFANKADEIFFNSSRAVEKAAQAVPDSIAEDVRESLEKAKAQLEEGMKLCEQRAQVAFIAFKDGWNVAKEFSEEMVTLTEEDEKRYKKAKKAAEQRAAESKKSRNSWKPRNYGKGSYSQQWYPRHETPFKGEIEAAGEDERGEYEEGSPKAPSPRGRLRKRLSFWSTFCNAVVLLWITFGVSLPWIDEPPPARAFANSPLAFREAEFVTEAVNSLVDTGAAYEKFKYEGLTMVRDLLDPDGYMWSFDFTSGYHHVELHPDSHQYVAFEWQGEFYCYAVLPFGLACAPYVFTRIGRELAKRWRQQGMKLIHYLDDFIFFGVPIAGSLAVFLLQQATVLADLDAAGFLLNP
ncbi:hypothetical protein CYMTET_55849 [Cymbomonas tetramitiformis]|uniref:Reverse transcriptase domain-containing protein n=1 Tax=Cymbomonas tetramitiformis TaxID=36881 RepID=A0AAE0EMY8_9CHLO|nr:hypothetical protein CYMTET_55849 [Cymbomonas tetramitiformis]